MPRCSLFHKASWHGCAPSQTCDTGYSSPSGAQDHCADALQPANFSGPHANSETYVQREITNDLNGLEGQLAALDTDLSQKEGLATQLHRQLAGVRERLARQGRAPLSGMSDTDQMQVCCGCVICSSSSRLRIAHTQL